jgi:hypothetical protein
MPCGDRVAIGSGGVAKFLVAHGEHMREYLEERQTPHKPTWRSKR